MSLTSGRGAVEGSIHLDRNPEEDLQDSRSGPGVVGTRKDHELGLVGSPVESGCRFRSDGSFGD